VFSGAHATERREDLVADADAIDRILGQRRGVPVGHYE
jgi:hypothetical protein